MTFLFTFSGLYFFGSLGARDTARARTLQRRGNVLFVLSLVLAVLIPSLILFTVGLLLVGALALFLFAVFVFELYRQNREMPWLNQR